MKELRLILDPDAKEIEKLIVEVIAPKGWGSLSRYSDDDTPAPLATWTLGGITPVGWNYVQNEFLKKGVKVEFSTSPMRLWAVAVSIKSSTGAFVVTACTTTAGGKLSAIANGVAWASSVNTDGEFLNATAIEIAPDEMRRVLGA